MLMFEEGVEIGEQGIGIARREGTGRKMLRYKTSRFANDENQMIEDQKSEWKKKSNVACRHNLQLFLECR
ncbi:hypothetical protein LWI28_006449 [Acer negundo]|uniref:Uncharacterized protein n=1 Tax=Acer negundo TaxID=4023 RepID=A0AAD5NW01_ACENE|nr:hypothetical protein LWI28_006449 [Acer negundo]